MTKKKTESAVSSDLQELPPALGKEFQRVRDLQALSPKTYRHYVYRHEGMTTSTPRALVGRLEGDIETFRVPDDYDIGTQFGPGLYAVLSKVAYTNAGGSYAEHIENNGTLTVGPEFKQAVPAAAVAAPPAGTAAAGGGNVDVLSSINTLDKLTDVFLKIRGDAPAPAAPGLEEMRATIAGIRKDSDDRINRLTRSFEEELNRLRALAKVPAAEEKSEDIKPEKIGEWIGVGVDAIRQGKEVLDMFRDKPAGGEA